MPPISSLEGRLLTPCCSFWCYWREQEASCTTRRWVPFREPHLLWLSQRSPCHLGFTFNVSQALSSSVTFLDTAPWLKWHLQRMIWEMHQRKATKAAICLMVDVLVMPRATVYPLADLWQQFAQVATVFGVVSTQGSQHRWQQQQPQPWLLLCSALLLVGQWAE